jgi:hypothetical protein
MKTHIIQLEQYDDIVSARDKMSWAKGERILLVWPERGRVLYRRLDLVLLERQSSAQGAQLALVSQDPDVRYYAPRLGIPVFKSLRKAQRAVWRLPRRFRSAVKPSDNLRLTAERRGPTDQKVEDQPPEDQPADNLPAEAVLAEGQTALKQHALPERPEREVKELTPATRLAFFALGVLALLAIATILLPRAKVSLMPRTLVQEVMLDVQAGPEITQIDLAGAVPARWVEVTVEGLDMAPTHGTVLVPDRPAQGEVLFTNLTDQPVSIPEGTVVLSPGEGGQRFAVTRRSELPAGPGETVLLPVRALRPGSQGNLPAGSLVAIEGMLGTQVGATNPRATDLGSDRQEPSASANDRRLLAERLHSALEVTAQQELQDRLEPGDLLLLPTLELAETLEERFQPGEGQPADQLTLKLRLKYRAQVVLAEDTEKLAGAVFDANLPRGFAPVEGSLKVENLGALEPETQRPRSEVAAPRWRIQASRRLLARATASQAVQLVMGASPGKARQRLQQELALEEPPQIELIPSWWPRLPILPFRVTVQVQFPGAIEKPPASSSLPSVPGEDF